MPLSIESLLETHPYKVKECLEKVCRKLNLTSNGTTKALRARIVTHVGENKVLGEKVRKVTKDFEDNEYKPTVKKKRAARPGHPLSPLVTVENLWCPCFQK